MDVWLLARSSEGKDDRHESVHKTWCREGAALGRCWYEEPYGWSWAYLKEYPVPAVEMGHAYLNSI
jgi:hypothetical protein